MNAQQMNPEEKLAVLRQVESIAALAELRGQVLDDGSHFRMGFAAKEGRSQQVFVRPTGHTYDGKVIVTVFSPARRVAKGMFKGLGREQAMNLLRLNENMYFARFGIWESATEVMIVASVDAILELLDAAELRAYAEYVSHAADDYESKHGGDEF